MVLEHKGNSGRGGKFGAVPLAAAAAGILFLYPETAPVCAVPCGVIVAIAVVRKPAVPGRLTEVTLTFVQSRLKVTPDRFTLKRGGKQVVRVSPDRMQRKATTFA